MVTLDSSIRNGDLEVPIILAIQNGGLFVWVSGRLEPVEYDCLDRIQTEFFPVSLTRTLELYTSLSRRNLTLRVPLLHQY